MAKMILGKKGRMTQMFTEDGVCVPVTILEAGPCWVTAKKTAEKHGYDAVQIGYEEVREKVLSKAEVGHCKTAQAPALRHLRELKDADEAFGDVGSQVTVELFAVGDKVDVIGTTKGRGYAGVMKRWDFAGGRMTHGGMCRRRPGSSGAATYPGRVIPGKRMGGHYGVERVTQKNLEVVGVDVERNVLLVKGAVPGHRGGLVCVRAAGNVG